MWSIRVIFSYGRLNVSLGSWVSVPYFTGDLKRYIFLKTLLILSVCFCTCATCAFLSLQHIFHLLHLTSACSWDRQRHTKSELRSCRSKGTFCLCNVCLYRQVIYVYVKGPVKWPPSCCRKHRTGLCSWNKSSSQLGELVFSVDGADMILGNRVILEQGVHAVSLNVLYQCCGFMHNNFVQNVQSDLECVGGYQGEINSKERKKNHKKGTF